MREREFVCLSVCVCVCVCVWACVREITGTEAALFGDNNSQATNNVKNAAPELRKLISE
jgi:hypothetical protein